MRFGHERALIQRLRAVLLRQGIIERARLNTARGLTALDAYALPTRAGEAVSQLRALIVALDDQTTRADAAVAAEVHRDAVSQQLLTITGIGPILGLTIRSEIGSIHRFPGPRELASYAGLVPRVDASAGRAHYGRITRRGSPWLRWALVEAAIHRIKQSDATGNGGRRLAVRKGALKARGAMARRLCEEVWIVWRRSEDGLSKGAARVFPDRSGDRSCRE
jgi:transposase